MKRVVPRLTGAARDLARSELLGLHCEVVGSPDAGLVGHAGEVVDETLHTLSLSHLTPEGERRRWVIPKPRTVFRFHVDGTPLEVPGDAIEFRSWDRIKKVR